MGRSSVCADKSRGLKHGISFKIYKSGARYPLGRRPQKASGIYQSCRAVGVAAVDQQLVNKLQCTCQATLM